LPSVLVKERLARDLGSWVADGIISQESAEILGRRYERAGFGLAQIIRYCGIVGGLLAIFGLLGLVGALAQSKIVGGVLVGGVAAAFLYYGLRMSLDPLTAYPNSARMLIALGAVGLAAAVGLFASAAAVEDRHLGGVVGLVVIPVIGFLAYQSRNTFLLTLGLIAFFHWVGSFTAMFGRSSYDLSVQDPRLMCMVALGVLCVGIAHERSRAALLRTPRFHVAYQAMGLVYLNLSLLILSIEWRDEAALPWVIVFTLATIGQILAGARLHSSTLLGFGVTFLFIDLYTRFHERFWDQLGKGLFFLFGGLGLLGAGAAAEALLRRARRSDP
jgi:hypothetical protein